MKLDETQDRMQSEMTSETETLLEIRNLKVRFTARRKVLIVVDGVSMSIGSDEIVGVAGKSDSGKSVVSQSILRLREYDSDTRYEGQVLLEDQDLLKTSQTEMRGIRGNRIAVIFQDPMTLLSPVHTVSRQLSEVLVLHRKMTKQRAKERCGELPHLAGIPNPGDYIRKYPCELLGGMQRRVMIAMALSCGPKLLIAGEPTTALGVTTQGQILDLVAELNEQMGMSILFITHDLGAMAQICRSVRIMYLGNLVEETRIEGLFTRPMHPYTQDLLNYIPRLDSDHGQPLRVIPGVVPPLFGVPDSCRFCTRCPYADRCCVSQNPPSMEVFPERKAKCWKYTPEQEAEQNESTIFGDKGPSEELPGLQPSG